MKWVVRIVWGLFGLLVLGAAVLFALGQRKDAGVTHGSVIVERKPEVVWAWVTEDDKLKQWIGWVVEIRKLGPTHEVWVMEDRNNGNARMEIDAVGVAFEPPRRNVVHLKAGEGFDGEETYLLTDLGGGKTRLEIIGHWKYDQWFARLMEPLVTPSANKKMEEDLVRLKSLIESKEKA